MLILYCFLQDLVAIGLHVCKTPVGNQLGPVLGPLGPVLGHLGPVLDLSWAILDLSWAVLGLSSAISGRLLPPPGRILAACSPPPALPEVFNITRKKKQKLNVAFLKKNSMLFFPIFFLADKIRQIGQGSLTEGGSRCPQDG